MFVGGKKGKVCGIMRDRLIELLKQGDKTFADKYTGKVMSHIDELYDFIADYLLANGVIVPPCKVGDMVYMLVTKHTHSYSFDNGKMVINDNQHTFIKQTYLMESNFFRVIKDFGKTVFLTKEEAKQALKGGEGE